MPDRQLIHSRSDVEATLQWAFDNGLQVILDEPQPDPRARFVTQHEIAVLDSGVFFLLRPEWVCGPLQFHRISAGHNVGKFFMSPNTNYSGITAYFHGERLADGRRRLGSCQIFSKRDWLEMPAKIIRETPSEVGKYYRKLVAHLSSGLVVPAGVHKFHIARGVLADPHASECLPPFDFIPWGAETLKGDNSINGGDEQ